MSDRLKRTDELQISCVSQALGHEENATQTPHKTAIARQGCYSRGQIKRGLGELAHDIKELRALGQELWPWPATGLTNTSQ